MAVWGHPAQERTAMNWMFESRSKNWYDGDSEGGTYSPPMSWRDILLFPFHIVLFFIFIGIIELLIPLGIVLHEFYSTAKRVSDSGELEYPGLTLTGAGLAILLPTLISNHIFDVSDHPIITFCAAVFVIVFTLAPLTGLVWLLLKQK
jgi:hypothetical protein